VVRKAGIYYLTNYDLTNHYDEDVLLIEKYEEEKVFTAVYFDGEQKLFYLKRFTFEPNDKPQLFIPEERGSYLVALNDDIYPCVEVTFKGKNAEKEPEQIDADEFIGVKGFRAKGKRLSTLEVKQVKFIEPLQKEEPIDEDQEMDEPSDADNAELDGDAEQMELDI